MTGIGTINPLGNNVQDYFANLKAGVSGAAPITRFDAGKFKMQLVSMGRYFRKWGCGKGTV